VSQSKPSLRWLMKVHRLDSDGGPTCGSSQHPAAGRALQLTADNTVVTCAKCLGMLRWVEFGLKAKGSKR
jgi:hypothetical protein